MDDEIDMVFDGMDSDCDCSLTMKVCAASEWRGNMIKRFSTFAVQHLYV